MVAIIILVKSTGSLENTAKWTLFMIEKITWERHSKCLRLLKYQYKCVNKDWLCLNLFASLKLGS